MQNKWGWGKSSRLLKIYITHKYMHRVEQIYKPVFVDIYTLTTNTIFKKINHTTTNPKRGRERNYVCRLMLHNWLKGKGDIIIFL